MDGGGGQNNPLMVLLEMEILVIQAANAPPQPNQWVGGDGGDGSSPGYGGPNSDGGGGGGAGGDGTDGSGPGNQHGPGGNGGPIYPQTELLHTMLVAAVAAVKQV